MDGGDSPKCALEKEVEGPLSGVRVVDAPILLLVSFHKALRAELADLYNLTSSLLEIGSLGRDLILDLLRRFRFLKLAYKYHCAAEDEVIFQALDLQVGNVVGSYSLEHRSIDDLFDSVFQSLNVLLEDDGNLFKPFQELVFRTGTIKTSICQHMLKEEEQVFPLLMKQFSFKEQASLVWQFISSVPIMLLEDFLPWMTSYLPTDERIDVVHCINEVVPKEKLLQEVVISWLGKKSQPSCRTLNAGENGKVTSDSNEPLYLKGLPKKYSSWKSFSGKSQNQGELYFLQDNAKHHPVEGLCLWQGAIRKDLKEILEELHSMRSSKIFSTLALVSGQLRFLADVVIFYSDALEKVFLPVLKELAGGCLSFFYKRFPDDCQIEGLLSALQSINSQNGTSLCKLVEKLYWELESFMAAISKHFIFQESEVFPLIRKHCNYEMQLRLLYTSLFMMPLGLLKCVITWLSSHLTEDESKAVLCSIKLAGFESDISFASLLHEWVRIGYSGKNSIENFRKELQEMFKNKSSFIPEQFKEDTGFSLDVDVRPCKSAYSDKANNSSASSSHNAEEKYRTLYSSGINLQIFFPEALKKLYPFSKFLSEKSDEGSSLNPELKPIDHIFLFHKGLMNDLEYLVLLSAKMAENAGFFVEFCQRFRLLRLLYQIHSDNEDEIAFPALEAKGRFQNISHSYRIDHKLEGEHFSNISTILDEISELHVSLSSEMSTVADVKLDQRMPKYCQLCMKLCGMCKTMCITLGKHFHREELELWPLFTKCFSDDEQNKIIGCILGRTSAEIMLEMIPWFMASLTPGEQHAMMLLWRKVTKNTMFDEWLSEWWEGVNRHDINIVIKESNILPSESADPLEIVASYLSKEGFGDPAAKTICNKDFTSPKKESIGANFEPSGNGSEDDKTKKLSGDLGSFQFSECNKKQRCQKAIDVIDKVKQPGEILPVNQKFGHQEDHIFTLSQEDMEAAIRRVSRDTTLDPQKKSYIIQNLLMSRWIITQQRPHREVTFSSNDGEIPGQFPSYQDPLKQTFGCKHYKRNCKLFAACCKQLFTCRYCHDDVADHSMDRKSIAKMMCMKCLKVQPIGPTCCNISCNGLSMAKYFCSICKLYDDEREIYHCPYCNLCRLGKGLGIDFFHCMNCNACMSKYLEVHICIEKCLESNCPICHDYIFTSRSPVKALPCGHLMHSTCFQEYTCTHYTCPICSKSLGDMQVYFGMLDVLLAEEQVPQEYYGQTQRILCNDCERRGVSPFHWLYHKCAHCGSYNTRLL